MGLEGIFGILTLSAFQRYLEEGLWISQFWSTNSPEGPKSLSIFEVCVRSQIRQGLAVKTAQVVVEIRMDLKLPLIGLSQIGPCKARDKCQVPVPGTQVLKNILDFNRWIKCNEMKTIKRKSSSIFS